MTAHDIGNALAKLNAALNLTSLILLLLGFWHIKNKRIEEHRKIMQGAVLTSAVFLTSYLTRFALTGSHKFQGTGALRTVYFAILFSHMILAVVCLPLVLRTLYLGRKQRFAEHRKIAKVTYPIWLYVSVTGVAVYVMLYHLA